MAITREKAKARSDGPVSHGALPRVVWLSPDYCALPGRAVKLLMDLACQYNGRNNGDLTVAYSVLRKRGWSSKGTISAAVQDLLKADLIRLSRPGQFTHPGGRPALYALTWKNVDECPGKDLILEPTTTPLRKFSLEANKKPGPQHGQGSVHNPGRQRPRGERGRFVSVHNAGR